MPWAANQHFSMLDLPSHIPGIFNSMALIIKILTIPFISVDVSFSYLPSCLHNQQMNSLGGKQVMKTLLEMKLQITCNESRN